MRGVVRLNFVFAFLLFLFIQRQLPAQFGALPPFTIDIEAVTNVVPGIHSYAFAQSGSKWLIIGGRTNGLHGFSSNDGFPTMYANNDIVVIDTTNWQYWTSTLNVLPYNIADPLRSTNMQFSHDSAYLYISGGFGFDSIQFIYTTFSTMTAIHVDNMINAVMSANPIAPHIRQITNSNLRVCGAEMHKMGNQYYLVFGHDFTGIYTDPPTPLFTQTYTNQVRRFTLFDDGSTLTVSNFTNFTDTANYHRRDLNVFPMVEPGGTFALGCYAGVFRYNINLPFFQPVYINGSGINVDPYNQVMSHYTCAGIPAFDSVTNKMYTTFFGGIGMYDYNPQNNTVVVDSQVPFIRDITTMTRHQNGFTEERVLPVQLPGLLGSNAEFIIREDLPVYANGVIRLRDLPIQRILAGYIHGGIRANNPNITLSSANDTVYRIYITPDFTIGRPDSEFEIGSMSFYPNPVHSGATLQFKLTKESSPIILIHDVYGRLIKEQATERLAAGAYTLGIDLENLPAGIYVLSLRSGNDLRIVKFTKLD